MGDQKSFSMVFLFAVVTLLNCCQASNFFLPRVSRTDDAIIIDLDGSGYAAPFQSKSWYGQIANPGFIPDPSFNPYPMMFRQQQRPSGWPYPSVHPSSLTPAGVPSNKQFDGEDEEEEPIDVKQAAATCGTGPTTMPTARALISERIAGGADAKKNAWPFMVALKKSDGTVFCSGTLVSDTKVLLAAQCLEKMSLFEINGVTALVGMYSTDKSDVQMSRRITKVVLHEKYNALNYANDIAILTLDSPVILSKTVAPACLPLANSDPDQYVDTTAMILGWGVADPTAPPKVLQQALVGFLSNTDCKSDTTVGKYDTDTTVCITSDKNNRFTCTADVGGPVVTLPSPGAWTIIGINSYTKDCTTGGLKTKVSAFRTWIDTYMK